MYSISGGICMKSTIVENYSLPSKGLIYKTPINPDITLRSMTLAEEMRRLQVSDDAYRPMSDVIDDCIENKLPISSYDMCLGDYQFLLHKLRIVTYGSNYKLTVMCPNCLSTNELDLNLEDLKINELPDNYMELSEVILPQSKDRIKIKFQTPRMLDTITREKKEFKKQSPDFKGDPTILITLQNVIDEINGKKMSKLGIQEYLKNLQMLDVQVLLQAVSKLSDCVGVDPTIEYTCKECGVDTKASFRFTPEFFTPTY